MELYTSTVQTCYSHLDGSVTDVFMNMCIIKIHAYHNTCNMRVYSVNTFLPYAAHSCVYIEDFYNTYAHTTCPLQFLDLSVKCIIVVVVVVTKSVYV